MYFKESTKNRAKDYKIIDTTFPCKCHKALYFRVIKKVHTTCLQNPLQVLVVADSPIAEKKSKFNFKKLWLWERL